MKKFKIGIQLYGVKHAMAADFEGTLKAIADMGYEYVEFAGYHGKTAEELCAVLDKYGLKCVSVHQSIDFFDENPQEKVDFLKAFGTKYSIIPWYDVKKLAGGDEWETTKAKFQALADLLYKNGMKLGYHNHDFEFTNKVDGKTLHDYIVEALPTEKFEPQFDTCWVHYAGINPVEKIKEFDGRVTVVHLKDFVCKNLAAGPVYALIDTDGAAKGGGDREASGFEYRPLGQGLQDVKAILEACEECGTEYVIVEQDDPSLGMSELECAKASRDYLRNTFGI
ncbi:MAG: sugar phosphate isomerase/epimerase [Clostridia bacterium]|nr:sugar phosphate isomerase/epimerase [Clostridia bacterium]